MSGQQQTLASWQRTRRLALVLGLATAVLWLFATLTLASIPLGTNWRITLSTGCVDVMHTPHRVVPGPHSSLAWNPAWPRLLPDLVRAKAGMFSSVTVFINLYLPLWPLPIAFAALAWYARTRIRRLQTHACTKCGYDTRGLAAGACCPECGAACSV